MMIVFCAIIPMDWSRFLPEFLWQKIETISLKNNLIKDIIKTVLFDFDILKYLFLWLWL